MQAHRARLRLDAIDVELAASRRRYWELVRVGIGDGRAAVVHSAGVLMMSESIYGRIRDDHVQAMLQLRHRPAEREGIQRMLRDGIIERNRPSKIMSIPTEAAEQAWLARPLHPGSERCSPSAVPAPTSPSPTSAAEVLGLDSSEPAAALSGDRDGFSFPISVPSPNFPDAAAWLWLVAMAPRPPYFDHYDHSTT
jgi:hypothetical protein